MSKRISPKGNTPPATANVIRNRSRKSVNDGIFGVNVLDSPYNPLISFDADKQSFSLFFEHEALTRNVGYWKYKGLEKDRHLIPWNISRMHYTRGGVMAFNFGNRKEILPFVISGKDGLDYYGLPFKIEPVAYANNVKLKLTKREYTVGVDCAIWLDVVPFEPSFSPMSRQFYNSILNNQRVEALLRVKMSMIAHFEKHVLRVEDKNTANKIRQAFRQALQNGDPVVVLTEFFEKHDKAFDGMTYVGGEFMATLKDLSALQDSYNGIMTSGYGIEKAERLVAGELSGIGEQVDIMADLRRRMAKRFARECRELLGWNGFDIEISHISQAEKMERKNGPGNEKLENDGSEDSIAGVQNV